jgi:hypothetical protein
VPEFLISFWCWLMGHATVVSVVVGTISTAIVAVFTIVLSRIGKRQADYMHVSEQAFVFAKGLFANYEPGPAGTYNWRLRPVWTNSGNTPTRHLMLYADCEITNNRITAQFPFLMTKNPPGSGMLGPKADSFGGAAPIRPLPPITPQDIVDSQNETKFIYLWGWARYSDVFPGSKEHITRFCWRIFVQGDPFTFVPSAAAGAPGSLSFSNLHMSEGTCTDDECVLMGLP